MQLATRKMQLFETKARKRSNGGGFQTKKNAHNNRVQMREKFDQNYHIEDIFYLKDAFS